MEHIVEFSHITKRFPGIVANDDISLAIKRGEIMAILGENGAGKTTLMSLLFGLYSPDEGQIFIRGKQEAISSPLVANSLNIGMVHQHFMLVENQSITENIILGVETTKKRFGLFPVIDLEHLHHEVLELSQRYHLDVTPTDLIEELPVSTRQRVEILKMLYRNAEILIFDEPTAVLTPQEIDSLLSIIESLRSAGKTIILITHKLDEVKRIADRCAILHRGKLVGVLDVATTSTKEMSALMVGREITSTLSARRGKRTEEVLRVSDLTVVSPDKVTLVNGASFSVHGGEVVAIAGVAGNGQVEVADAIAGLLPIDSGEIELTGTDISRFSIRERTEAGISYIPEDRQSVGLILDFPLRDNLCLKQYYRHPFCNQHNILQFAEMEQLGERLIEEFDIRSSAGNATVVRSMSGGNQQKAIVARELNLDSQLFIFVQPTRGLDVGAIAAIHQRIDELRSAGKAILLVSLELDEIMELADTIIVMYNGKIQAVKEAQAVTKLEVGEYMMGVHDEKA